ncbi:hypothetical protein NBRC3280_2538 [Acetobacter pasteurianus NBRC 3280]|uniref:HTH cro/C1-type domain-containing protein n=1 Tax=Acetobacter pasteurianus NBRC 3278 TaxID=1226660 RepID=A0A401X731_ACEPA|nr:helix-turn-helix transcriptional regulator [Acetobacter pasteurianus]GCD59994.1 hypothetical protein NBRC3277_2569 [Acetobacter pasteurianus NBRC 3277]GCD63745.1 hypothetical protein NBRC3278_2838 [Acetobacter pasteurianus NBRC 3278]GCD69903.1 hypothetical protein NBRC3280_2538 [Acetobacter pasteurianus NBRC 3280]
MICDARTFGQLVKECRKRRALTQKQLALISNVGVRFIIDLECGKPTCHLDKALKVARMAGLKLFSADQSLQRNEAAHSDHTELVEDGDEGVMLP